MLSKLRLWVLDRLNGVAAEVVAERENMDSLRIHELEGIVKQQREQMRCVVPIGVAVGDGPVPAGTVVGRPAPHGVNHWSPAEKSEVLRCCGREPHTIPPQDRVTPDKSLVTCKGKMTIVPTDRPGDLSQSWRRPPRQDVNEFELLFDPCKSKLWPEPGSAL